MRGGKNPAVGTMPAVRLSPQGHAFARRAAVRDVLKRIWGTLVWFLLIGFATLHYLRGVPAWKRGWEALWREEWLVLLLIPLFALVSAVPLFRLWYLFSDRRVCGILTDTDTVHYYGRGRNRSGKQRVGEYMRMEMRVTDENGVRRRVYAQVPEGGFGGYYRKGERILHLRGVPYPVSPDAQARGEMLCPFCGTVARHGEAVCPQCTRHIPRIFPDDGMDG